MGAFNGNMLILCDLSIRPLIKTLLRLSLVGHLNPIMGSPRAVGPPFSNESGTLVYDHVINCLSYKIFCILPIELEDSYFMLVTAELDLFTILCHQ